MNMAVGFENMLTKGKLFEAMKAVTDSAVMSPSSSLLTQSHYFLLHDRYFVIAFLINESSNISTNSEKTSASSWT